MKKALPINKDGKKMYPVCSWGSNQHKFYNAHDKLVNAIDDAIAEDNWKLADTLQDKLDELEDLMDKFNYGVSIDGIVYAIWEDRCKMLDLTWTYNARHC